MAANQKIREAAQNAGVKLWEIAARIGVTDSNFSRKLRVELSEKETKHILSIISALVAEKTEVS